MPTRLFADYLAAFYCLPDCLLIIQQSAVCLLSTQLFVYYLAVCLLPTRLFADYPNANPTFVVVVVVVVAVVVVVVVVVVCVFIQPSSIAHPTVC